VPNLLAQKVKFAASIIPFALAVAPLPYGHRLVQAAAPIG